MVHFLELFKISKLAQLHLQGKSRKIFTSYVHPNNRESYEMLNKINRSLYYNQQR